MFGCGVAGLQGKSVFLKLVVGTREAQAQHGAGDTDIKGGACEASYDEGGEGPRATATGVRHACARCADAGGDIAWVSHGDPRSGHYLKVKHYKGVTEAMSHIRRQDETGTAQVRKFGSSEPRRLQSEVSRPVLRARVSSKLKSFTVKISLFLKLVYS